MLNIKNLEQFSNQMQTSIQNVVREYCQHLFLSFLYRQMGSERLLFKGGTALRIVLYSPRFSEDLDFTGVNITQREVENVFTDALAQIEHTGVDVEISEGKPTTGGYLGIAVFRVYGMRTTVQIEVSLRHGKTSTGVRAAIRSDYLPPYTLVHLPIDDIIHSKLQALEARHKPRDFYDYFFLLSGNHPSVRETMVLRSVLGLLRGCKIDFHWELKKFLPRSHAMHLRGFKKILEQKIMSLIPGG